MLIGFCEFIIKTCVSIICFNYLSTKTKILDSAEALFAKDGISNSSLRGIVKHAGVNVAAVHYHFGSKQELIKAVFERRIKIINQKRLDNLEVLRVEFNSAPIPIKKLLKAFISPAIQFGQKESCKYKNFLACIARAHAETEDVVQVALYSNLKETLEIFMSEIKKSCPDYNDKETLMRFSFVAGAMVHTMLLPLKKIFIEKFFNDGIPNDEVCDLLVEFCAAGFVSGKTE